MRRVALSAAVIVLGSLALAGCSGDPDPKAEWTNAMKAEGFVPNAPHTYDEMFESAKQFCSGGSALTIAGLARTVLNPEQAETTAMPARGKNPDEAATVYGDATWKWACGHA